MEHIKPINQKAKAMAKRSLKLSNESEKPSGDSAEPSGDVRAMAQLPLGCTLSFNPGWEAGGSGLVTGLCQPMQSDLYGCYDNCSWPVQVPDQITNYLNWNQKDGVTGSDWRKLDLIFPDIQ
jgi:hypothetical protein